MCLLAGLRGASSRHMTCAMADRANEQVDLLHVAFGGLGGHAAVIAPLTDQLVRSGIRSGVIAYGPASELARNAHAWSNLDVVLPVPHRGQIDLRAMVKIARASAVLRPRLVLCHTHKPVSAVFAGMMAARLIPRLVLVEHQAIELRSRAENVMSAVALCLSRAVVVLTEDYRDRYPFRKLPLPAIRRLAVIPNGVDTNHFSPAMLPSANQSELVVGMASRLTPAKDVDSLIRAIGLIRHECGEVPVRLEIAGSGTEQEKLELLVARLNLESSVCFVGNLTQPQLIEFFQRLDIYVQSTEGETACTAILQAWATGVPVIGSDVEGVKNLVRDGIDALLVEPGSPAALADALAELLACPEWRDQLGRTGRRRAVEQFGAEMMAQRYLCVMREIDAAGSW